MWFFPFFQRVPYSFVSDFVVIVWPGKEEEQQEQEEEEEEEEDE